MDDLSELARQLYDELLARGYYSPETSATLPTLLGPLLAKNSKIYNYFLELDAANLVVKIESQSINNDDRFYVVAPPGFVAHLDRQTSSLLPFVGSEDRVSQVRAEAHWGKWGAIASIVAIPVALIIWWFS